MKKISRYSGRRYYCGAVGRAINQKQIKDWVLSGEDVRVTCMVTRRDITVDTLFQLLLTEARRKDHLPELQDIISVIRSGKGISDLIPSGS
jgi:polyhydroxyalkanoate synthesis regulator protein